MVSYKLKIVVQPFSPTGGIGEVRTFLEFADAEAPIRQVWNQISDSYKKFYLNQSDYNTFTIKKLQDEDGADIDVTRFTLEEIFQDTLPGRPKTLNVIPGYLDRDLSIPVTSALRPVDAPRRPPVPLFNPSGDEYLNVNPDRPISSTERGLASDEAGVDGLDQGEDQNAQDHSDEQRERIQRARNTNMDVSPEEDRSNLHLGRETLMNGNGDGRGEYAVSPTLDNGRILPQANVLATASRGRAEANTNSTAPPATFAKPALPARALLQRPGQLSSPGKQSKSMSRLVSRKFPSQSTGQPQKRVAIFNSRTPFEVEVPETDQSDVEEHSRNSREVSRATSANRPSRNTLRANRTGAALSDHPAALITPPTSIDDLPFLRNLRPGDRFGGLATTPAHGISDILTNSTMPTNAQGSSVAPLTGAAHLDRVLNRNKGNNKSDTGGLSVPTLSQGPKLRSPFQPVGLGSAAPTTFSTTTDDTAASPEQHRVVAKSQEKPSELVTSSHRASRTSPSLWPSELNGGMDEVEDSMHEDAVERASVRRKQSAAKRRSRASASSHIMGSRSSSRPRSSSTTKKIRVTPAAIPVSKTAPVSSARQPPKSTPARPSRQPPIVQPQSSLRSIRSAPERHAEPDSAPITITNADHNPSSTTPDIVDVESPEYAAIDLRALAAVRDMSIIAIGQVDAERLEAENDIQMEDAIATTPEDNAIKFPPPPPDLTPMGVFEVHYPVGDAEQAQLDKVSEERNEKTLTWLRNQQEEAFRAGRLVPPDAVSASAAMSQGRKKDRAARDSASSELPHKKPDPKGKKRAAVSQEDRELLASAGFHASDDHVETYDEDDEEAGHPNASPSTPAKSRTDKVGSGPSGRSPAAIQTSRPIQPFAVVIRTGPSPVKGPSSQQRPAFVRAPSSASQEIPTSAQRPKDPTPTPTPSQVIPTSAQQPKAATPASSQAIPASAQQPKATARKSATPKPTPSQEFFAFLPTEPSQSSPKRGRKRKDRPSSPVDNLASELRAYGTPKQNDTPKQKKRKTETPQKAKTTQNTRIRSGPPPGSSLDDAIVVASDVEAQLPARSSSRSRRATTAVPTFSARSPAQRSTHSSENAAAGSEKPVSPTQSRLRSSSSRVPIILDGAADSEIESVEVSKVVPKRPAAPTHRNSALLMGNKKRGIPQDDVMELDSGSDNAQPADVEMQDAPSDEEDGTDNDLLKAADHHKSDSESTPRTGSLTGSQQLENDLQSSANGNPVTKTVARLAAGSSLPSQSTQLSQPTQSSTMRSPESSPARSVNVNDEMSTPVALPRQRSSTPDWVTPSHIRERDEYRERVRQAQKSPSATQTKLPVECTTPKINGMGTQSVATASAQLPQKQSVSQKVDNESDSDDSETESGEEDEDEEGSANTRSKSSEAMPPPQLPIRASVTPARGILKKTPSDSTLPSTQHVRRVSIDPAASGGRGEVFSTTQRAGTSSPNGVTTRSSPRNKTDVTAAIPPAFLPLDATSAARFSSRQSPRLSASQPLLAQKNQETQSSVSASQPAPKPGKLGINTAEQSKKQLIEEDEQDSEESDEDSRDDNEEVENGSGEDDGEHGHPADVKLTTQRGFKNSLSKALTKAITSSPPINGAAASDEESTGESEEEIQSVKKSPARMPTNSNRAIPSASQPLLKPSTRAVPNKPAPASSPIRGSSLKQPLPSVNSAADSYEESSNESEEEIQSVKKTPAKMQANTSRTIPSASQPLPKPSTKVVPSKPAPASSPIPKPALKQPTSANGANDSEEDSFNESEGEVHPVKEAATKMPIKTNGKMPSASQPLPKASTRTVPKKPAPASSPLRKPAAKQPTTNDSDDSSSSDDDDDGYSHASDDVDAIEAEVAQYLVSHPREKVGGLRSIIKFARRDERQEQRRAATKEAERQKRVAWQNNISMEDPDRVNRMSGNYQPRVRKPNV